VKKWVQLLKLNKIRNMVQHYALYCGFNETIMPLNFIEATTNNYMLL